MGDMADAFLDQVMDHEDNVSSYLGGQMSFGEAMECGVLDEQGFLPNSNNQFTKEKPMTTAKRTRTKGVKGTRPKKEKKEGKKKKRKTPKFTHPLRLPGYHRHVFSRFFCSALRLLRLNFLRLSQRSSRRWRMPSLCPSALPLSFAL